MKHVQDAQYIIPPLELKDQHKQNSSEEIIHRERIAYTPFEIIGNKKDGYFLAFGKFKVSSNYSYEDLLHVSDDEQEPNYALLALEILDKEQWMITANILLLMKDLTAQDIYKQLVSENKIKTNNND